MEERRLKLIRYDNYQIIDLESKYTEGDLSVDTFRNYRSVWGLDNLRLHYTLAVILNCRKFYIRQPKIKQP